MLRHRIIAAGLGAVVSFASVPFIAAASAPAAPVTRPGQSIAARVGQGSDEVTVPMDQLQDALIQGYGLNVLLNLVQLNYAKAQAAKAHVTVTPADIQQEREDTLNRMFQDANEKELEKIAGAREKGDTAGADKLSQQLKQENEQALDQVLSNQHLSRAEFDIVTETNAYLRKIVEPMLVGRISDANLHEAFDMEYGATIKCRHIQCANLQEIAEAKRRLDAGEPFAQVAMEMSRNAGTRGLGGELPPFNLQTQGLPEAFKQAAWALKKEGDVSDPVMAEGGYHLIKLIKRIPPKAVKFEDVKESLRKDLYQRAVQAGVKELRQKYAADALAEIQITNPELAKQWAARKAKNDAAIKGRDAMRRQMDKEREQSAGAATQPATQP